MAYSGHLGMARLKIAVTFFFAPPCVWSLLVSPLFLQATTFSLSFFLFGKTTTTKNIFLSYPFSYIVFFDFNMDIAIVVFSLSFLSIWFGCTILYFLFTIVRREFRLLTLFRRNCNLWNPNIHMHISKFYEHIVEYHVFGWQALPEMKRVYNASERAPPKETRTGERECKIENKK